MIRMLTLIPLAVLLVACGGFIELTPDKPLGDKDEIDTYLAGERPFDKKKSKITWSNVFEIDEAWEKLEDLETIEYEEDAKGTVAGDVFVKVTLDAEGKVVAITGRFHSRSASWSDAGGLTETFISLLWKEVAQCEASFTKQDRGGPDINEYLLAEFDNGTVAGRWEKCPTDGRANHTKTIWDNVFLWVK